jgi:hypothetical protein
VLTAPSTDASGDAARMRSAASEARPASREPMTTGVPCPGRAATARPKPRAPCLR